MDFDLAAQRLARDQSKLRQKKQQRGAATLLSSKQAQRALQQQQAQHAARLAQKQQVERAQRYRVDYMTRCEAPLRIQELTTTGTPLCLKATSIHGEGDKLALPPSVLEYLTNHTESTGASSPWIFRVAIRNPQYAGFPQSPLIQQMEPPNEEDVSESMELEDDEETGLDTTAYLDELSHRYWAWAHGTVVEFTQEEGCVGLPAALAASLIQQGQSRMDKLPVTRTVDPASGSADQPVDVDMQDNHGNENDDNEKTPGHLAWGQFDVPTPPVEVSLVQLPKGRACVLQPTHDAIRHGFYQLPNVKFVLEQSLQRTRAVLAVGDTVHTWHRGVQYDLKVTQVEPADYRAVVCINTDLTVDFAVPAEEEVTTQDKDKNRIDGGSLVGTSPKQEDIQPAGGYTLSGGRTLCNEPSETTAVVGPLLPSRTLPEEPTADATNVCTVQIRGPNGASVQRRLDLDTTTIGHLFALSQSLLLVPDKEGDVVTKFQLVTRFPRRVLQLGEENQGRLLQEVAGLKSHSQELFLIEHL